MEPFKTLDKPNKMIYLHIIDVLTTECDLFVCVFSDKYLYGYVLRMFGKAALLRKLLSTLLTCVMYSKMHLSIRFCQRAFQSGLVVKMCALIFLCTDFLCIVRLLFVVNCCSQYWQVCFIPLCTCILWEDEFFSGTIFWKIN